MALYWGDYGANQSAFDPRQGDIGPDSPPDTDLLYTHKFFDSYNNLANTTFIHGLNLYRYCGHYSRVALTAGLYTALYSLGKKLLAFELGNEPEAYPHACIPSDGAPGTKGEPWNRAKYVQEWESIAQALLEVIPKDELKFIGPSIANGAPGFDAWGAYENGH